jgi:hypothetical protein
MNAQTSLQLYLVLHIVGFTMMAGTIVADFVIRQRMNKYLITEKNRSVIILESAAAFPLLISIGALLLISTGVGMVIIFKGLVFSMLWFRIKMILVVLTVLNGAIIINRNTKKLKGLLNENSTHSNGAILALNGRMAIFYSAQIILLLSIFVLSVFRF